MIPVLTHTLPTIIKRNSALQSVYSVFQAFRKSTYSLINPNTLMFVWDQLLLSCKTDLKPFQRLAYI